jgi:hypothetical protein
MISFFRNQERKGYPVIMGEADSMASGEFAAQGVQFQMEVERVCLQIAEHPCEARLQFRVPLEEFAASRGE